MASTQIPPTDSLISTSGGPANIPQVSSENMLSDPRPSSEALLEPNPDRPSAVPKTFSIVELLEQVLVQLDIENLTRARRVCRMWNIVIEDSRTLRKIRFLEPIEPWAQVIRRPRFRAGIRMSKWVPGQGKEVWVPLELHPAFYKAVAQVPRAEAPQIGPPGWDLSCQISVESLSSLLAWVSANTQHKALICQPPCKRLRCWIVSPSPPDEVFHSTTGVTFQDLLDLANSKDAETHRWPHPHVHFSLLDVTNVTDDENKARIGTARKKYERREMVAQKKLAVKENRRALDKISVFDRSDECDLSALFEDYSLESWTGAAKE